MDSTGSSLEEEECTPPKKARLDDDGDEDCGVSPSFWSDACQFSTVDTPPPAVQYPSPPPPVRQLQLQFRRQGASHFSKHQLIFQPPFSSSTTLKSSSDKPNSKVHLLQGQLQQEQQQTPAVANHSSQPPPISPPFSTTTWKSSGKPKCIPYRQPDFGLNVEYYPKFFKTAFATEFFKQLEKELAPYLEKSQNQVKIMGKMHKIPRKQAAFGDAGLSYNFSGVSVPANPWIGPLSEIRHAVMETLGEKFNFVLVNRYKDGSDHIGEHRDDEKDLVPKSSIASVSLGQGRDFVFKHRDMRGKAKRKDIDLVSIHLEHGSLLAMKYPTNTYWYHSLPVRKSVAGPRINLTFRLMKV